MRFLECRPHMNSNAAASRATAAAPITTPAIPPPDSPELLLDAATAAEVVADAAGTVDEVDVGADVELGAAEEVVKGFCSSEGHASPGCSMNVEFFANWVWTATDSVPLGLMTPTIP